MYYVLFNSDSDTVSTNLNEEEQIIMNHEYNMKQIIFLLVKHQVKSSIRILICNFFQYALLIVITIHTYTEKRNTLWYRIGNITIT